MSTSILPPGCNVTSSTVMVPRTAWVEPEVVRLSDGKISSNVNPTEEIFGASPVTTCHSPPTSVDAGLALSAFNSGVCTPGVLNNDITTVPRANIANSTIMTTPPMIIGLRRVSIEISYSFMRNFSVLCANATNSLHNWVISAEVAPSLTAVFTSSAAHRNSNNESCNRCANSGRSIIASAGIWVPAIAFRCSYARCRHAWLQYFRGRPRLEL